MSQVAKTPRSHDTPSLPCVWYRPWNAGTRGNLSLLERDGICSVAVPVSRMVDSKYVFQITGIKNMQLKLKLLHGIRRLDGKYIGGSIYRDGTTHMIVTCALASEKFLAACASGKWIVTPQYVMDSLKNGAWLPEEPYEVDFIGQTLGAANPIRMWRTKVASGSVSGAFQGWRVVLQIDDLSRSNIFKRSDTKLMYNT
uniref:BRCT domain-containing protein n=1 Tax=Scleropages formosus TaxID=113540 RepID=A0A8C9V524_SCLFO